MSKEYGAEYKKEYREHLIAGSYDKEVIEILSDLLVPLSSILDYLVDKELNGEPFWYEKYLFVEGDLPGTVLSKRAIVRNFILYLRLLPVKNGR